MNLKIKAYAVVLLLAVVCGKTTFALPLLAESAAKVQQGIITVWPDHEVKGKYYFFPNSTHFARDEQNIPLFNFVYWGFANPDDVKGAYMSLTTRLESDKAQQEAIDKFLKDNPGSSLAVAPVMRSTVGLTSTKSGAQPLGALFEEFNFSKVGGRAEDEMGVNAVLTPAGARAFRGLLLNAEGGSALKFDYCYVLQGLGPNMDASIQVNFKRIYEYFESHSSGGYMWFSYSISLAVEKLQQEGSVHIKMNGGNATEWEMLQAVAGQITTRLFQPTLTASPQKIGEANSNFPFRFTGGGIKKTELKSEVWTWKRQDLVEREYCTAIPVKDLAPYKAQLIVDADKTKNYNVLNQ